MYIRRYLSLGRENFDLSSHQRKSQSRDYRFNVQTRDNFWVVFVQISNMNLLGIYCLKIQN